MMENVVRKSACSTSKIRNIFMRFANPSLSPCGGLKPVNLIKKILILSWKEFSPCRTTTLNRDILTNLSFQTIISTVNNQKFTEQLRKRKTEMIKKRPNYKETDIKICGSQNKKQVF